MSKLDIAARIEAARVKLEVFEMHIKPFIKERELVLFDAFCKVDASNPSELAKIKMQHTVLVALEAEFKAHIDDGKMAQHELNTLE